MLAQIHTNQKVIENFGVSMVKNGYSHSSDGTLKLTVTKERTD